MAVGLILIIACVNVAGLLLARGATRDVELAIRAAIGAGRGRLVRQLLTESLLLALAGALAGLLLAYASLNSLVALIPLTLPANSPVAINATVLLFALGLTIVTAVLFGLVPALKLSRAPKMISRVLGVAGRSGAPLSKRAGQWLIGVEIALALVRMTGAGLILRSFATLVSVDLGFDTAYVLALEVEPLEQTASLRRAYYAALADALRRLPEVVSAGAINDRALSGSNSYSFPTLDTGETLDGPERTVLPGYLEAMGVRPIAGRLLEDGDRATADVVVINAAATLRDSSRASSSRLRRTIQPHSSVWSPCSPWRPVWRPGCLRAALHRSIRWRRCGRTESLVAHRWSSVPGPMSLVQRPSPVPNRPRNTATGMHAGGTRGSAPWPPVSSRRNVIGAAEYNQPLHMTLSPGTRLGPYEVVAPLGAGGMGQVYRARDTRLGRDVALKTLPEIFSHDPERLGRFRREAQVLASLNHPHIAAIYGLEESRDGQFLVLEFVDGETLADRLTRGPVPADDALVLAGQIAEALDAAHEKGIIHRDLKPANIALTGDGTIKVLDFGLAKATETAGSTNVDAMQSPTLTSPALVTGLGVILGTAAYMSPEQARGRAADRRSDVWAFGCVLYEMLSGRRAFAGEDVSDTMASVLRDDPDWQALPPGASRFRSVLRRTLEKDPKRRLRDIGDVKLLMDDSAAASGAAAKTIERSRQWRIAGAAAAGAGAGTVLAAVGLLLWASPPVHRVERFTLTSAMSTFLPGGNVAISPTGSHVVYTRGVGTSAHLVIRPIDRLEENAIPGTERGRDPFFSPDGREIGFATLDELRRIPIEGGTSLKICRVSAVFAGASWGPDNSIVFAEGGGQGLFRVKAGGGDRELLAAPDTSKGERNIFRPTFLPDGRSILYTVGLSGGQNRIDARRLDRDNPTTIVQSGFGAQFLSSGHLLYGENQRLMAVPFDTAALRVAGPSVPVYEDLSSKVLTGVSNIATAADGTVVFASGGLGDGPRHVVWIDPHGSRARALEQALDFPRYPRLSPDGRRLAITTGPSIEGQVWIYDLERRDQPVKLTHDEHNLFPIWSSDGTQVVFLRRGRQEYLVAVSADGRTLEPETLMTADEPPVPLEWARLSNSILFRQVGPQTRSDLLEMRMADQSVRPWLRTPWDEYEARISTDGKRVAYVSDRAGHPDIWVSPYDDPNAAVRLSAEGGRDPVWSRDGRELFYRNGQKLMAARVLAGDGEIRFEERRQLFEGGFETGSSRAFDVGPDGRFLMIDADERVSSPSIVLVRNWGTQLKESARQRK